MIDSIPRPPFSIAEAVGAGRAASSLRGFLESRFYRAHGAELEGWLWTIRSGGPAQIPAGIRGILDSAGPAQPGDAAGRSYEMRLVQWNIQQGRHWDRLKSSMQEDMQLRGADLWTLAEVDCGTVRAGNRDVARELASLLGLHWIFVPTYFEFTKGTGEDALLPGENEIGLHGIALFSRWPFVDPGSAALPMIFDYYSTPEEKRYGARRILWATVKHPRGDFLLATAHLEVRNTPAARSRQIEAALRALPPGPCLLAGDWNTHTFRRGSFPRSAAEFVRILMTPAERLQRELLRPSRREPLLRAVARAGFDLDRWNDHAPTALQVLSGVEELESLPPSLRAWLERRFGLHGRTLRMRLDWIASRGPWVPAPGTSPTAWTRIDLGPEGLGASDHAPIGIDARWPREETGGADGGFTPEASPP